MTRGAHFGPRFGPGRPALGFGRTGAAATPAGPVADPSTLPNTAIWYDTTNLATMWQSYSSANTPAEMDAPVGRIVNAISGDYLCRAYVDNGRPTLRTENGRNYLAFDGISDRLRCTGDDFGAEIPQPNIICLGAFVQGPFGNSKQIYDGETTSPRHALQIGDDGRLRMRAGSWSDWVGPASLTGPQVVTIKYDAVNSWIRINGVEYAISTGTQTHHGINFATSYNGGNTSMLRLSQYIAHNGDLTAEQLATLEAFTASKIGVTLP